MSNGRSKFVISILWNTIQPFSYPMFSHDFSTLILPYDLFFFHNNLLLVCMLHSNFSSLRFICHAHSKISIDLLINFHIHFGIFCICLEVKWDLGHHSFCWCTAWIFPSALILIFFIKFMQIKELYSLFLPLSANVECMNQIYSWYSWQKSWKDPKFSSRRVYPICMLVSPWEFKFAFTLPLQIS